MKRILLPIASLVLLIACATPESEFQAAESENTIEAYQTFIETYPGSELVDQAAQRLCSLKFDAAVEARTFEAFETLLAECPEETVKANEQTALLMGRVVGRFVSSEDGEPLNYEPGLFRLHQELTEAELARAARFQEQHGTEVSSTASGGFQISNVYPGRYNIMVRKDNDIVGSTFEVGTGAEVDLGDIEVPVGR